MTNRLIDIHYPLNVCSASAGTGKTFTLAAYYVGLLLSGVDYRSILAITFTNKATAEMSERILGYLYGIANGEETAFLERAKQFMISGQHFSAGTLPTDAALRCRAGECFRAMLLDFDNVQVQTIDSFLQTLLSGMASVLRMSVGLKTELDIDQVIRQAVDQLLTTDMTATDRVILEDYMQLKLDQESNWDVRQSLREMAKELYNEAVQVLDAREEIIFDATVIETVRQRLTTSWQEHQGCKQLQAILDTIHTDELAMEESVALKLPPHGKDVLRACERLRNSLKTPEEIGTKDRFRGLTETQLADAKAGKWTKLPEEMVQAIVEATELAASCKNDYNTLQLTIRFSRDMQLMASLQTLIQRNLMEANCALLAKTANTLCNALRDGDADFILEKAGIRYHHILIDEFQDTSQLQWRVIRRLLDDVLASEGNTLLIVGDIKQSIYRWRNGDWHIMASLGSDEAHYSAQINRDFPALVRNFRSREEIVRFNLSLFRHINEPLYDEGFDGTNIQNFYQAKDPKKAGGYVHFKAFQKLTSPSNEPKTNIRETIVYNMFDEMESLLAQGAKPSDMMVLIREKRDAIYISDLFSAISSAEYPYLSQVSMVSSDSFLLESSRDVQTIIYALRYLLTQDDLAAKYIELACPDKDALARLQTISSKTPLYETVSEIISRLLCDETGAYCGSETAYVNSFLDRVRDYVSAYGSRVEDFLAYWDDTLHKKPISAGSNEAICILTIHASKGLQAQTVFIPFCTWTKEAGNHREKIWCPASERMKELAGQELKWLPIQDGVEMAESDYAEAYAEEHRNMVIDNLNMLYVALTRAEDNLYISTFYPVNKDGQMGTCNHVGRYIMDFLGVDEYVSGSPVISGKLSATGGQRSSNPFSFEGTESQEAQVWSNSEQVRFVQSQEGAMYTDYGDEAYRRVARIDEGTLCHEIFAHLRKADELDHVLDEFESRGEINGSEQRERLKSLISTAWEGSEMMRDWFTAPWQLHLEEAVYIDQRELRPDRVMINPDTQEAIVLDYKFGQWNEHYMTQVRDYMRAMRNLGYAPVRGYLWFAHRAAGKQLVEVKDEQ